jgi:hypothetical protein
MHWIAIHQPIAHEDVTSAVDQNTRLQSILAVHVFMIDATSPIRSLNAGPPINSKEEDKPPSQKCAAAAHAAQKSWSKIQFFARSATFPMAAT